MSIGAWWFGPATDGLHEDATHFGGRVILVSHYDEIRADFEAACDDVVLFRGPAYRDGRYERSAPKSARSILAHPSELDESARDAMTLAGYVDNVDAPVMMLQFGNKVPGVLRWMPSEFSMADAGYQGNRRREALAQGPLPDGFDALLADEAFRRAGKIEAAYRAAAQRIEDSDGRRTVPLRSWDFLARAGIWLVGIGLMVWLVLASSWPVPAYIVAGLAVATSVRASERRIRNRVRRGLYDGTWERGPLRLRVLTRQDVRDARWNDHRDIKVAVVSAVAGAALTYLFTVLA